MKEKNRLMKRVCEDSVTGCWNWNGYFQFQIFGKREHSHRASWILFNGEIPKNHRIIQNCSNKRCVNPKHLSCTHLGKDFKKRFFEKVIFPKNTGLDCWGWAGGLNGSGYGSLGVGDDVLGAHVVSYIIHHNVAPSEGDHILHTCDNPACVNPDHLFLGTHSENMVDMIQKGRSSQAKLSVKDVLLICTILDEGKSSVVDISKMFNVNRNTIHNIDNGSTWNHLTRRKD